MQGLRNSKLGYKDMGIRNSEFVAKAQFISNIFLCFKEKKCELEGSNQRQLQIYRRQ